MKVFNLTAIIIIYSNFCLASVCSQSNCPKGREPTSICFIDPAVSSGALWKASSASACGYFTEKIVAPNVSTIARNLERLARECKSLDRLTTFGHGSDGHHSAGGLDNGTVQDLNRYSCLFNANAEIQFMGCNVGRGCSGDMLLFQAGKNLLGKGGTVTAPSFYASTSLPGIWPHTSLNWKNRELTYNPSNRPPDSWNQRGLAISNGGDINERCVNDLKDLMDNYSNAKVSARKRQCSITSDYVSNDRLNSYKEIQSKLARKPPPYLQQATSSAWYDLSSALGTLKYQIWKYEQCEPPQTDRSNSRSSGAVQ